MPREYPPYVWVVAKALFMEGKTTQEIAAYFQDQPTKDTIDSRAYKVDAKTGKNWIQERDENAELAYLMLSPSSLIKSAYEDMIKIMQNVEIDPITKMDALSKAGKFIEKFSDPRQKVTQILQVMQDFLGFLESEYRESLMNDTTGKILIDAVRNYKDSRLKKIVGA